MSTKSLSLGLVTGLTVATCMFGQSDPTFKLTGYVYGPLDSPYQAEIGNSGGGNPTAPVVQVFCDDVVDGGSVGFIWNTYATNLNALPDSPDTVYYDGPPATNSQYTTATTVGSTTVPVNTNFTEVENYIAASYLALQILELPPSATTADAELSAALWAVFEPGQVVPEDGANFDATAKSELDHALALSTTYASVQAFETANNISNVTIYSATNGSTPCRQYDQTTHSSVVESNCSITDFSTAEHDAHLSDPNDNNDYPIITNDKIPQEFIAITVPEPSTLVFLGIDVVGGVLFGLYFLRRKLMGRA